MNFPVKNIRLSVNWEWVKHGALFLAAAAALFFLLELFRFMLISFSPLGSVRPENVAVPEAAAPKAEPLEEFQKKLESRNLFEMAESPAPAQVAAGIDAEARDLALIGIVATGEPEAIVKDSNLNQTYLVRRGQRIRSLLVKEVRRGSIVLQNGREEKELFLE
jgi:hypothetical protein